MIGEEVACASVRRVLLESQRSGCFRQAPIVCGKSQTARALAKEVERCEVESVESADRRRKSVQRALKDDRSEVYERDARE